MGSVNGNWCITPLRKAAVSVLVGEWARPFYLQDKKSLGAGNWLKATRIVLALEPEALANPFSWVCVSVVSASFCTAVLSVRVSAGNTACSLWLIEVSLTKGLSTKKWAELKELTEAHRFSKPLLCVCWGREKGD